MSLLAEIEPKKRGLVMDLVREAGIDVSDWANCKGGSARAASNPKYCYEWSFRDPDDEIIVMNLWFKDMRERDGRVVQDVNMRTVSRQAMDTKRPGAIRRRADKLDLAIRAASRKKIGIRIIVCAGDLRGLEDEESRPSSVKKRMLDPVPWSVAEYDAETSQCLLVRGGTVEAFVDQFSIAGAERPVEYTTVDGRVAKRSAAVRAQVLRRADGSCEWCGTRGFSKDDGSLYLETHHIVPLCEGGPDVESNVAALCPNHHREAHHGAKRADLRTELIARVARA